MTATIIPFPVRPSRASAADHQLGHLLSEGRQLIARMDDRLLNDWLAEVDSWTSISRR